MIFQVIVVVVVVVISQLCQLNILELFSGIRP